MALMTDPGSAAWSRHRNPPGPRAPGRIWGCLTGLGMFWGCCLPTSPSRLCFHYNRLRRIWGCWGSWGCYRLYLYTRAREGLLLLPDSRKNLSLHAKVRPQDPQHPQVPESAATRAYMLTPLCLVSSSRRTTQRPLKDRSRQFVRAFPSRICWERSEPSPRSFSISSRSSQNWFSSLTFLGWSRKASHQARSEE